MSNLFGNKVAAALLASALGVIGIQKFANVAVHADIPAVPAYQLAVVATTEVTHVEPAPFPSELWVTSQDAVKGAKVFKKCTSCHNANNGGKNGTGPALWNILGRSIGTTDGFKYSTNMAAKGGTWGYEELDAFLAKPKDYIPKTKMAFNGLKKEKDRAALIEFLRLQADSPLEALLAAAPIPGADHMEEMQVEMPSETPMEGEDVPAAQEDHAPKQDGGH